MAGPPRLDKVPTIREYEETVRRLKYEAMRTPDIQKVLPLTVLVTGARISEVLMLTTIDVNEEDLTLSVPTLKRRDRGKRIVPVPSWYIAIVQHYIVRNAVSYTLFPVSRTQAWRIVRQETGYPPHAWRHAYGMYLLYKGVDPESVKRILGHTDWDMIEYYVRVVKIDLPRRTPLEEIL